MTPPKVLPIATIQHTLPEVVDEIQSGVIPSEKIWVSCYKHGEESVHARLITELDEVDRNLMRFRDGEGVDLIEDEDGYKVTCPSLGVPPTRMLFPVSEYADPERSNPRRPHRITAFALSPDRSQFATGFLDGSIHIYPTGLSSSSHKQPKSLPEKLDYSSTQHYAPSTHKSTVTSLRFFPSSRVLLSTSSDFSLQLFPADLPSTSEDAKKERIEPARVLVAHTRAVTCSLMIGKGRQVISGSADGTLRVWDVSKGEKLSMIAVGEGTYSGVVGTAFLDEKAAEGTVITEKGQGEGELGLVVGLQDGRVQLLSIALPSFALSSTDITSASSSTGTMTCLAYDSHKHLILTGHQSGLVNVYDPRSLSSGTLFAFRRGASPVTALCVFPSAPARSSPPTPDSPPETDDVSRTVRVGITTQTGLPYVAKLLVEPDAECDVGVEAEIVSGECDAVGQFAVVGASEEGKEELWTAGDEGVVRRYFIA